MRKRMTWKPSNTKRNDIWIMNDTAWMRPDVSGRVTFWMTVRRMTNAEPAQNAMNA